MQHITPPIQQLIEIETGFHNATDDWAMTSAQLRYIEYLGTENIEGWGWRNPKHASQKITKAAAAEIIDALLFGHLVKLV